MSEICTIMELKELNLLCSHMKNVRSSQPCISINHWFFPVGIVIAANEIHRNIDYIDRKEN